MVLWKVHYTQKTFYVHKKTAVAILNYRYCRVRSSTSRVQSSADKLWQGFGWVQSSTSRVRNSSKFVNFGFVPTLIPT